LTPQRRASAVTQQPLQGSAVVCFNEQTSVNREAAVPVAQHLFGLKTLQQAAADEGSQDASAQGGLQLELESLPVAQLGA